METSIATTTLKMGDCEILKPETNSQFLESFPTLNEMGYFSSEIVTANPTAFGPTRRELTILIVFFFSTHL